MIRAVYNDYRHSFSLQWKDDEGDTVTVATDMDLQEAIHTAQRFSVIFQVISDSQPDGSILNLPQPILTQSPQVEASPIVAIEQPTQPVAKPDKLYPDFIQLPSEPKQTQPSPKQENTFDFYSQYVETYGIHELEAQIRLYWSQAQLGLVRISDEMKSVWDQMIEFFTEVDPKATGKSVLNQLEELLNSSGASEYVRRSLKTLEDIQKSNCSANQPNPATASPKMPVTIISAQSPAITPEPKHDESARAPKLPVKIISQNATGQSTQQAQPSAPAAEIPKLPVVLITEYPHQTQLLVNMGFDAGFAQIFLQKYKGNFESALEEMLQQQQQQEQKPNTQ